MSGTTKSSGKTRCPRHSLKSERPAEHDGRGKLFVFEGPDGSGKTTLSRALAHHLEHKGLNCRFLAFPGLEEGTLGKLVYDLHHEFVDGKTNPIDATSLQLLHIAAHIDAIKSEILPVLASGIHVVLDRYWWSTWVYGLIDGADQDSLRSMIEIEMQHWCCILPAMAFLIVRRTPYREQHTKRWSSLAREYTKLAKNERQHYTVRTVENERDINSALSEILGHVDGLIAAAGTKDGAQKEALSSASSCPNVFSKLAPARPTVVYETFWRFAAMRQEIFFARFSGRKPPWTEDQILQQYKFTNAYRASDRVSQYLIRNVIYAGDQSVDEVFFRTILFKIFNRIETWELLLSKLGEITFADYSFNRYNAILSNAMCSGTAIYSPAYIMPSGGPKNKYKWKHTLHLKLLEQMMREELPRRLADAPSMIKVFETLRSYHTIGDFLAYQYATDLNYGILTDFNEMAFVVPGPGARDGIRKCFSDTGGLTDAEMVKVVTEQQNMAFEERGLKFRTLWGRPLQLIDCQNLFCEVDKYARLKHPDIKGHSNRSRIKQRYQMNPAPIDYWYPPKWELNDRVEAARRQPSGRSQPQRGAESQ